jgi:hypothetical protein
MTPRAAGIVWGALAVVFLLLLAVEISKWHSLTSEGVRAATERQRLTTEIQLREQQLLAEMRRQAPMLQEMQSTSAGGDPSAFLGRLAELAQEKRMKVVAIGPLERQATAQFSKSWHTVQVQAPFREVRELALRVEQDKGILEDVRLDQLPATPSGGPQTALHAPDEIEARFKMTAIELSPQAKQIVERAAAAVGAQKSALPPLALPIPSKTIAQAPPPGRDPFSFLTPPAPPRAAAGPASTPEKAMVPLDVKGIVSFPDGFLAIINNQIVKVGDTVSGHRVERITDNAVTLREPGVAPRMIELPGLPREAPVAPGR